MAGRDYLLDILERAMQGTSEILARVFEFKRTRQYDDALDELDDTLEEIGVDPFVLDVIEETSVDFLTRAGGGDRSRALVTAKVLAEKAEVYAEMGIDEEVQPLRRKALTIYLELWASYEASRPEVEIPPETRDFEGPGLSLRLVGTDHDDFDASVFRSEIAPAYRVEIPALAKKIPRSELTRRNRVRLYRLYEALGEYARAEDEIDALVRMGDPLAPAELRRFYARLVLKNDEELERGGLPRHEILEAL